MVGSVTHCPGLWAAATAPGGAVAALGIDAEVNQPLPHEAASIVTRAERLMLARLPPAPVHWDRALFSAKESVFKAWWPVTGRRLGFEDVHVTLVPALGAFYARLLVTGPVVGGRTITGFGGRLAHVGDHVLTAVAMPAPEPSVRP